MNFWLSEEDLFEPVQRPLVSTWRSALKQLDQHPWQHLYPLSVHPEFRKKIAAALKARLKLDDESAWSSWKQLLGKH